MYRDVVIRPGDVLFGDVDGVVRIPAQYLDQVYEKAEMIVNQDAKCMRALQDGMSLKDAFAAFRK